MGVIVGVGVQFHLEKWQLECGSTGDSRVGVDIEQSSDDLFGFFTDGAPNCMFEWDACLEGFGNDFILVFAVKGQCTAQQQEHDDATTPTVDGQAVSRAPQHFRSYVGECAARHVHAFIRHRKFRQTKVTQNDVRVVVHRSQHYVLRLQISMHNASCMQVSNDGQQFEHDLLCLRFSESFSFEQSIKQIAASHIGHDQSNLFARFKDGLEFDDVWMMKEFENGDFSSQCFPFALIDFTLVDQFDGIFLAGFSASGLPHRGESSDTQLFSDRIILVDIQNIGVSTNGVHPFLPGLSSLGIYESRHTRLGVVQNDFDTVA